MNKKLLTAIVFASVLLSSQHSTAQAHQGVPVKGTPSHEVKAVPKGVQRSFDETKDLAGLLLLNQPKWVLQNGLYTVTFRSTGEYGPGFGVMRFKGYGGLVMFNFKPDMEFPGNVYE